MKSEENGLKTMEPEKSSIFKMISFSVGYFFATYTIIAFNNFVWTFYESELGIIGFFPLWSFYMTLANAIYTIYSIIMNPILGYYTDKPTKWVRRIGYHTPWAIIGGIPTMIFFFLLFTPPQVAGFASLLPILIYYIVIVLFYDTFSSLFQTHSFGAFAAHFRGDKERRRAGLATQFFTFVANFLAIAVWSLIIRPGDPNTFTTAAFMSILILTVSFVLFLPGFRESDSVKERFIVGYETAERVPFFKTMIIAVRQKNFMLGILTYFIFMLSMGLMSMNSVNFVDDVLEESQSIRTIASALMLIFSVLTMPLWARVARKIGHSRTYVLGLLSFGIILLISGFVTNAIEYYIVNALMGVTAAMYLIMLSPVLADCYDEIAVKIKKHREATLVGIRNIFVRIALPIQSLIIAIIYTMSFYNPADPIHSDQVILGLRLIQGVFPFVFCIIGALVFFKWYDLKGKKKAEMMNALNELGL